MKSDFDLRVYLFLLPAIAIAVLFARSEAIMLAMFVFALIWKLLSRQAADMLSYIFLYAGLWGATRIGFTWLNASPAGVLAAFLSNTGVSARKALPPLLFALTPAKQPTGSLMAALNAMRLPKPVGISIAIMLRFFPTLSQEYRAIRNAQRFRGVGVGFWNTLAHIPRVLNYIVIPLTIRITRISEELSASIIVRGVRFGNQVISFRPMRFSRKDGIALSISLIVLLLLVIIDDNGFF